MFTFSFDDGYQSWLRCADILEEYGYRGVFNVCLRNVVRKRVPERRIMFPYRRVITWDEVHELQRRGHQMGSHGVRHVDLDDCNWPEIHLEIIGSKQVFESRGVSVDTFACPFNNYNERVKRVTLQHYGSVRGSPGFNQLPFKGSVYHAHNEGKQFPSGGIILSNTLWNVGIWHDIAPAKFREAVEAVHTSDVKVLTVSEAIKTGEEPLK